MKTVLKTSLAAAMIAGSLTASPALAEEQEETVSAIVEYRDLDLSTEDGRDVLHARLRHAARYVCGMDIDVPGSRFPSSHARACYTEKLQSFERQVATVSHSSAYGG